MSLWFVSLCWVSWRHFNYESFLNQNLQVKDMFSIPCTLLENRAVSFFITFHKFTNTETLKGHLHIWLQSIFKLCFHNQFLCRIFTFYFEWESFPCQDLIKACRWQLLKDQHNKNFEQMNWKKEQWCQPFCNYKIANAFNICLKMTSFRSLSHLMLWIWSKIFVYLYSGALYDKW